ncbi:MAG: hypothetical protein HUU54_00330 [Ignavibacteriaceae bacterium]|nr:hypothetical protein [Ignavibacteriaceae bacterium]
MLQKRIFLLTLCLGFLFFSVPSAAQIRPGAKQAALSQSDIAAPCDVFSIYFNPAGSKLFHTPQLSFYYAPAPYGLTELKQFGVHGLLPFNDSFTMSAGIYNYGFKLYHETHALFNISHNPHRSVLLGLNVTAQNLSIERYGNSFALRIDAGAIFLLSKTITIGLAGTNITGSEYSDSENSIPRILRTGISYQPLSLIRINAVIEAETNFEPAIKIGSVIKPHENFSVRSGYNTLNKEISAGLSVYFAGVSFDYGFTYHRYLGASHFTGVSLPDVTSFF